MHASPQPVSTSEHIYPQTSIPTTQDEVDLDDAPVSRTFAEQTKERALLNKQISIALSESRKRSKELRKAKHAARISQKKKSESSDTVQSADLVIEKGKGNKTKKKVTTTSNDEFTISTTFNPAAFANEPDDFKEETSINEDDGNHNSADVKKVCCESDEGYNGSDEQDPLKTQSLLQDEENDTFWGALDSSGGPYSNSDPQSDVINQRPHIRGGRRTRKRGRDGAFHVELLGKGPVEQKAREEAQKFLYKKLFSPLPKKQFGDFGRVRSEVLTSLANKRRVRKMQH